MIKIPARGDGQWTVQQRSDKLPDISATKNLTFDKEGYLRLSKPVVGLYSEADDADFGEVLGMFASSLEGQWMVCTNEKQFQLDMYNSGNYGTITLTEDTNVNTPDNTSNGTYSADAVSFAGLTTYSNPADRKLYTHNPIGSLTNDWTVRDISASIEQNSMPVAAFTNQSNIAVGNENQVDQFTSAYAAGTQLVIPDDYRVTGVVYNNGLLCVTTAHVSGTDRTVLFVWDGNTAEANYSVEVPSHCCFSPTPYMGTFVFIDGNGVLTYWSPNGLQPLAALPGYYGDAVLMSTGTGENPRASMNHSIKTDGEIIHLNIKSVLAKPDENNATYNNNQPGGVYTYDPAVGLYHRYAPVGVRVITETIATTAVDTTDDEITVTAAPDTGTPVRYSDGTGTAIAGLANRQVYYAIKVDATTIQLAETYTDAIATTAIDLTGTGNNNQSLQFYPKTSFGQTYVSERKQGMVHIEQRKDEAADLYFQSVFFGSTAGIDTTTEYDQLNMVLQDTENRGYFITSKFMSSQLQEDWQKMFIKHKDLVSGLDKIVVKYRIDNNEPLTRIKTSSEGVITWTDSDTFTTTDTQWSAVQSGDEVEFIQGTGSGYLAHITSISEDSGTYTVNIDETIKNLTASDTGRAIASRWNKLTTLDNGIISNDDGFSEITVGVKSKQIQFKVELRGEDIEVEEILIAHQLHKPVA